MHVKVLPVVVLTCTASVAYCSASSYCFCFIRSSVSLLKSLNSECTSLMLRANGKLPSFKKKKRQIDLDFGNPWQVTWYTFPNHYWIVLVISIVNLRWDLPCKKVGQPVGFCVLWKTHLLLPHKCSKQNMGRSSSGLSLLLPVNICLWRK